MHPSAIAGRAETQARRRHFYSSPETEATLSALRAVLPELSASRLVNLGLVALVDRLKPQDAAALERELTGQRNA